MRTDAPHPLGLGRPPFPPFPLYLPFPPFSSFPMRPRFEPSMACNCFVTG